MAHTNKNKANNRKSLTPTVRLTASAPLERPRLNLDEVNFVLDLNAQLVGALIRISKLEEEVAELQAKLLVSP